MFPKFISLIFLSVVSLLVATTPSFAQDKIGTQPASENYRAYLETANCKPIWPKASIRNEETGTVILAFLVGADGKLIDSKIERSSGFRDLDNSAHFALRGCTFHPAIENGKPVESWFKFSWVWKMQ